MTVSSTDGGGVPCVQPTSLDGMIGDLVRRVVAETLDQIGAAKTTGQGDDDPDQLLTFDSAADLAAVSTEHLRREAQLQRLAVVEVGKRGRRIRRADLRAWIRARRVGERGERTALRAVKGGGR
jgi:excisionase family DNA binding protein